MLREADRRAFRDGRSRNGVSDVPAVIEPGDRVDIYSDDPSEPWPATVLRNDDGIYVRADDTQVWGAQTRTVIGTLGDCDARGNLASHLVARELREAFDPHQPRDERGRWTKMPGAGRTWYHVAPTQLRARIQTHGLQAARPGLNDIWSTVPGRRAIASQPEGVYVTDELDHAERMRAGWSSPADIWSVDGDALGHLERDTIPTAGRRNYRIPHSTEATLAARYEDSEDFARRLHRARVEDGTELFGDNWVSDLGYRDEDDPAIQMGVMERLRQLRVGRPVARRSPLLALRESAIRESNFTTWARDEVKRAGLLDSDSDYEGMVGKAVLKLVDEFSGQGHSGFSAGMVASIFQRLAAWKPLTPLTDDPGEWMQVDGPDAAEPYMEDHAERPSLWQSRRQPDAFSYDGGKTYYLLDEDANYERYVDPEDGVEGRRWIQVPGRPAKVMHVARSAKIRESRSTVVERVLLREWETADGGIRRPAEGDRARLLPWGSTGKVTEVDNLTIHVDLDVGGQKIVPVEQVEELAEAAAPGVTSRSAMVALYPPRAIADAIAAPGGLEPHDLHVTLAFLGDLDDRQEERLRNVVDAVAAEHLDGPLRGQIAGTGVFTGGERPVTYASLDVPGINELREKLVRALDDAGLPASRTHSFTPHMTLAYRDLGTRRDAPVPVRFGALHAVVGNRRRSRHALGRRARLRALTEADGEERHPAELLEWDATRCSTRRPPPPPRSAPGRGL